MRWIVAFALTSAVAFSASASPLPQRQVPAGPALSAERAPEFVQTAAKKKAKRKHSRQGMTRP